MISPEILRKNKYFTDLNNEQVRCLIESSCEIESDAKEFLFHRDHKLQYFYLVTEGEFEIIFESPKIKVEYETHQQPSQLHREVVIISTVGKGEIFGWSGLVRPFTATSCVRAKNSAKAIAFDCKKLLECFDKDYKFGFYMIHAAAVVIGKRLQDTYKGDFYYDHS